MKTPDLIVAMLDVASGLDAQIIIEKSELRGQQTLVHSQKLPIKGLGNRAQWEQLGFIFGAQLDDLFVSVTLPDGWVIEPEPTHMYFSYVVDHKKRKRATIFYKAAMHDTDANITLLPRFNVNEYDRKKDDPDNTVRSTVFDAFNPGEAVYTSVTEFTDHSDKHIRRSEVFAAVTKWIETHYPDWQNPLAYWD